MIHKKFIQQAVDFYENHSPVFYNIRYRTKDNNVLLNAVKLTDTSIFQNSTHLAQELEKLRKQEVAFVEVKFYGDNKNYLNSKGTITSETESVQEEEPVPNIPAQIPAVVPQPTYTPYGGLHGVGLGEVEARLEQKFEIQRLQDKLEALQKENASLREAVNEEIKQNEAYEAENEQLRAKIAEIDNAKTAKREERMDKFYGAAVQYLPALGAKILGSGGTTPALSGTEDNSPRGKKIAFITQYLPIMDDTYLEELSQQLEQMISQQPVQNI